MPQREGIIRISSDGDHWMGANIKTQKNLLEFQENPKKFLDQKLTPKNSHAELPSLKNFQKVFNDITWNKNITNRMFEFIYSSYHGTTMYIIPQIFEYTKNPYLNEANQKYLPKFPTQKNPGIKNFQPTRISSTAPPPSPWGRCMHKKLEGYPGYAFHQLPKNP